MVNFRIDNFNWATGNPCFIIFLVRAIYQGNPDRNHMHENIVLKEALMQMTYENYTDCIEVFELLNII
jgi:hypothetical protein